MSSINGEIRVAELPDPKGHYAHAVACDRLLFVSGQLPDPEIGADADFASQVRSVIDQLFIILRAAGSTPADLLKVNVYIVGIERWLDFNAIYAETFGEAKPARAVIPVPALHYGWLIEIDAVAARRA